MSKNKKKFVWEYNEEDAWALLAYTTFIDRHIKTGDKIPARVLKKFFGFFNDPRQDLIKQTHIRLDFAKAATLQRYSKNKLFNFSKNLTKGKFLLLGQCTFTGLIDYIFSHIKIYSKEWPELYKDKLSFISQVQKLIENYFNAYDFKTNKLFSPYRRAAIAAYITHKMGFIVSKEISELEGKEPTNSMLEYAGRYKPSRTKKEKPATK